MTRKHDPYRVLRYCAIGALEGMIGGWVLLIVMLWLDLFGLAGLIARSGSSTAIWMLAAFFAITFSLVGLVWRIMVILPNEREDGK